MGSRPSSLPTPLASWRVERLQAGRAVVVRGDLVVRAVGPADVEQAVELLDRAEHRTGAPLVDESERARLHGVAHDHPNAGWYPLVACHRASIVGYAGVTLTPDGGPSAELVVDHAKPGASAARGALLEGLKTVARARGAHELIVWLRHASDDDLAAATSHGFELARRLVVLGRPLTQPVGPVNLPAGHRLRPYRPDRDDEAVVAVLAAAFAGTPDAGWDTDRLSERRTYGWYDPDDILLAEEPTGLVRGVHWTKRRGGGMGEVYVLATHPDARGGGLGRALLRAGLHHLRDRGCRQAILWVDEANRRAVHLYRTEQFTPRWTDLALAVAD